MKGAHKDYPRTSGEGEGAELGSSLMPRNFASRLKSMALIVAERMTTVAEMNMAEP